MLASRLGGEIVSCDAMMVYREPQIIVNKPTPCERAHVPHHMIDLVSVSERFDAARFAETTWELLRVKSAKPLVMCGGSGMYVRTLIEGIFDADVDPAVRGDVAALYASGGLETLAAVLRREDPISAVTIDMANPRRVMRALEVFRSSGESIVSMREKATNGLSSAYDCKIVCLTAAREDLYARIDERAARMFEQGVVDEVRGLLELGMSDTAAKILGVSIIQDHLDGKITQESALRLLAQKTRNYAKRQLTWFRGEPRTIWVDRTGKSDADVATEIAALLYVND
jgi:tRNA dimethylallyltransferase